MCVFPFHYLRSAEQQRSLLGPKADGNRYEDIAAAGEFRYGVPASSDDSCSSQNSTADSPDALGLPIRFVITPGQWEDYPDTA
jgi:hypothetical protein